MGYCMSRYDDVRLDHEDGASLETRRESFCLRWPSLMGGATVEIAYADVPRLRELIDIAFGPGGEDTKPLHSPTEDQATRLPLNRQGTLLRLG